jgi:hypothetical protein
MMHARSPKLIAVVAAIGALALPTAASARHGADDPAGHHRHAHLAKHHKKHHHVRHHARHGADDGANHR